MCFSLIAGQRKADEKSAQQKLYSAEELWPFVTEDAIKIFQVLMERERATKAAAAAAATKRQAANR